MAKKEFLEYLDEPCTEVIRRKWSKYSDYESIYDFYYREVIWIIDGKRKIIISMKEDRKASDSVQFWCLEVITPKWYGLSKTRIVKYESDLSSDEVRQLVKRAVQAIKADSSSQLNKLL